MARRSFRVSAWNTPNGDRAELQAWHAWLRKKYADVENLSTAWSTMPDQLRDFEAVPLPATKMTEAYRTPGLTEQVEQPSLDRTVSGKCRAAWLFMTG
jgi:beta-galactosidase GanA